MGVHGEVVLDALKTVNLSRFFRWSCQYKVVQVMGVSLTLVWIS